MFRFVLGRAASGKTLTLFKMIEKSVKEGKRPVLLVPEQFSFESEKSVLELLGDHEAQAVSVISFTRLCDEVERNIGGICGRILTESDKLVLMSKAIASVSNELRIWNKYSRSLGFAESMLDAVNEFKINSILPDELIEASKAIDGTLSAKLIDTAKIYSAFNILVSEKFIDPNDKLTTLYLKLEEYRYFDGRDVYIDSFKGFTGQQFKILDRIVAQAANVTVSLTDTPEGEKTADIFYNIKQTEERLLKIAKSHHCVIGETLSLYGNHYSSASVSAVESLMCENEPNSETIDDTITICRAATIYDEAEFVARNIRRLVREKGIKYRDIVVIARDTEPYEEALLSACNKNGVSCFSDKRLSLESLPPCRAVLAATDFINSFSTENILKFYKTGIDLLSVEEISILENYTYMWNVKGADWEREWDMDPSGFKSGDEISQSGIKKLEFINKLRIKAINPLIEFKISFKNNAPEMSKAIVKLLDRCNAQKSFSELFYSYKNDNQLYYADAIKQAWDSLMHILDSLSVCFGESGIKQSEYCDALRVSLSLNTVGVIPQMLDEVSFGSADRIRPSRPKVAFIMGANHGVFPKSATDTGLFAPSDRAKLIKLGIDIPDKVMQAVIDEEYLVYSNVCCPSDALYISYRSEIDGTPAEPSAFVSLIEETIPCKKINEPDMLTVDNLPETLEAVFSEFCKRSATPGSDSLTLLSSIEDDGISSRVNNVISARKTINHSLSTETATKLFGTELKMSPTRLEEFNRCKFMYFCKNGLRAKKIQPAEFNPMQRGTLIHFVLQKIVEKYGKGLSELDDDTVSNEVDILIEEYLNNIPGYQNIRNPRLDYLITTMSRSAKYVVQRLAEEFSQSEFEPIKCELRIGEDGDIPEIKIPVDDIGTVSLTGIVDRLDTWNGYIRIIDYKTGHRDFKLPDILVGQNMQMLIYLYALCRSNEFGGKPAGILYMPARRFKDESASKKRMNGVIKADIDLVTAMEKDNKGNFVPKLSSTPSDSFVLEGDFEKIFEHIDRILYNTAREMFSGNISVDPIDGIGSVACDYCDFKAVCRIGDTPHKCAEKIPNSAVIEKITKAGEKNGI